jgi:hypothetical protein
MCAPKPWRKSRTVTACARLSARTRARWVHRCDAMRFREARGSVPRLRALHGSGDFLAVERARGKDEARKPARFESNEPFRNYVTRALFGPREHNGRAGLTRDDRTVSIDADEKRKCVSSVLRRARSRGFPRLIIPGGCAFGRAKIKGTQWP